MTAPSEAELGRRLAVVRERIAAAGAEPGAVEVLAVTKGFGSEVALAAARSGLVDLGENYAQELVAKADAVAGEGLDVRWHAIGRLQRNKVRAIASMVWLWQSVDRPALGEEIARRAPGAKVLIQVDVTGEPQKGGCPPSQVADLASRLTDLGLEVRGLMAVGPAGPPESARPGFALVRRLADELGLSVRSMGMSGDLEVAVEEGSTLVRVGRDLFGARPPRTQA